MTARSRRTLLAVGGVALLVVHVIVLHRISTRLALPLSVGLAVLTVVVLVHLGVFRKLAARVRGDGETSKPGNSPS